MYTLEVLEKAEHDLYNSCEWYEEKKKGLANRFLKELHDQLRIITRNPYLFQVKGDTNLRFSPLKKFPYVIVYWFDELDKTIFVASIFHTSRKPFV